MTTPLPPSQPSFSPSGSGGSGTSSPRVYDGAILPSGLGGRGADRGLAPRGGASDARLESPEKDRLADAFDAIGSLANCIDQVVREIRRGTSAQWRPVQDELNKVRRLASRQAPPREGPPRDEGPASQPPPPASAPEEASGGRADGSGLPR